jgi:hypothetical protein
MDPRIPTLDAPKDCTACSATCPLKKAGCAHDWAQALLRLEAGLVGLEVPVPSPEILEALREKARTCRQGIVDEIQTKNAVAQQAQVLLDLILPVLRANLPELAEPRPAASELDTDEGAEDAEEEEQRRTRGKATLLVDPEDAQREQDALALPDVHGICVSPRLFVEKLEEFKAILPSRFQVPPFGGLVVAIARRYTEYPHLCRVTAYYRGPPPVEAKRLLKAALAPASGGSSA